jgi:hypothetical protein
VKKPVPRKAPKPRNVAAKALAEGQFQPRVQEDPKTYRRREKHPPRYKTQRPESDDQDDGVQ